MRVERFFVMIRDPVCGLPLTETKEEFKAEKLDINSIWYVEGVEL